MEKLGSLYYKTKEYEKAIYAFEKAVKLKPNEEILTKLVSAREKVKKHDDEAITNHNKIKKLNLTTMIFKSIKNS